MLFRDELQVLNAIYDEQKRSNGLQEKTNILLEKLLIQKEGSEDVPKGRGGGNRGKVA